MKIVAVVPMKLNNQRLPQKNTKAFTNGQPLCTYILNTLLSINEIEKVYVYCSNPEIANYLPKEVNLIIRDLSLDQDSTSMNEVLLSFTQKVSSDIYVMAHTTAPFISKESIEKGIRAVLSGKYDSSFAAKKIQEFLWENGKPMNYQLNHIPRTQDLPEIYAETSGFYIYIKEVIKHLGRRIGNHPFVVEVNEIEAVDIDEPVDFEIADALFNYFKIIKESCQ